VRDAADYFADRPELAFTADMIAAGARARRRPVGQELL
jgi:hypothetical protein